ncbi:MAG: ribonuclease E/G [Rhodothalassiaceae bacterium]
MSTRMLVDARHPEETRVAVVKGNRVEELDYESANRKQLKGNIYLAKVTRVEPSLQACFVEYGGNRHGFLAFSEIHPDYYQIPVEDREALIAEEAAEAVAEEGKRAKSGRKASSKSAEGEAPADEQDVEQISGEDDYEDMDRRKASALRRRYKIQEVIKRRQILLVQVVKEERGSKGAALTTYLSLAGRYCVLMPNSPSGGGISRKIANASDRKKLKDIMSALDIPDGMGCIIRTAGLNRTKAEIKRDYDYLIRLWSGIRERTLKSVAPALIHEEAGLIMRSIRDLYTRDVDEILVEGDEGYRAAKDFMKLLMPSHAKKVQNYKDTIPLFHRYQVESQIDSMYSPVVQLKSGGYIVINQTEALVAIDVNSGRSTKEHNIEETALKTNLEAADEVARQLRLRDLAGLIVIDFIDMDERGNNRAVEKRLKDALKTDRARIQVGRISAFGLIEMSRQRLRPNLLEGAMVQCPTCAGAGIVRSTESAALAILRELEEEGVRNRSENVTVTTPVETALYLLNQKRDMLLDLERRYDFRLTVVAGPVPQGEVCTIERTAKTAEQIAEGEKRIAHIEPVAAEAVAVSEDEAIEAETPAEEDEEGRRKKRRRRRRGRRGRGEEGRSASEETISRDDQAESGAEAGERVADESMKGPDAAAEAREDAASDDEAAPQEKRRRSRRRRRKPRSSDTPVIEVIDLEAETAGPAPLEAAASDTPSAVLSETPAPVVAADAAEEAAPPEKPRRRVRRKKADDTAVQTAPQSDEVTVGSSDTPLSADKEEAEQPVAKKPVRKRAAAKKKAPAKPAKAKKASPEREAPADTMSEEVVTASPATAREEAAAAASGSSVTKADIVRETIEPEGTKAVEAIAPAPDAPRRKGWWQRAFGN